jgi:monoamine oxidase
MLETPAVIVVGAGVAGLSAAAELARSGLSVTIIEARDRIGGRIFIQRDPASHAAIALGAEFVHGTPPEIWQLLRQHNVPLTEVSGDQWCFQNGRLCACEIFSEVDAILKKMDAHLPDESFLSFLERCLPESGITSKQREAKRRALSYVIGFNAADPERVGVHWLVQQIYADEKIKGDRAFRSPNGYEDLLDVFRHELARAGVTINHETVVKSVNWSAGRVEIKAHKNGTLCKFIAPRALLTLPLGVLKASSEDSAAVQFNPALPREKIAALQRVEMGAVIRVSLRFRRRFWDDIPVSPSKTLSEMSFLFSEDEWYPTWWTTMPEKLPIITGWAPFTSGQHLSGKPRAFVIDHALNTLGSLLGRKPQELSSMLVGASFHDWQSDPFSRGAYSYGGVGADDAQRALGSPIDNVLFFAGEATDSSGYNGTVHGAISSGHRAAQEILRSLV